MMREKLLHVARMSYDKLPHHPATFEIFGVDMMLDSDLNLYFIEMVSRPGMNVDIPHTIKENTETVKGAIELELALMYGGDIDKIVAEHNWHWVIDGRKDDISRYSGLLSEECL
jgi:hypothetical protein